MESQTWMITILIDGTLMIDLIQGLADFPRRTPKISPWIRMPCSFHHTVADDPIRAFVFYKSAMDSGEFDYPTPSKVILFSNITLYFTFNLDNNILT